MAMNQVIGCYLNPSTTLYLKDKELSGIIVNAKIQGMLLVIIIFEYGKEETCYK